jgi:hypothetical protein
MGGHVFVYGRDEKAHTFYSENLKGRDDMGYKGVDGRMI